MALESLISHSIFYDFNLFYYILPLKVKINLSPVFQILLECSTALISSIQFHSYFFFSLSVERKLLNASSVSKPATAAQLHSFLLYSVHSGLNVPEHLANFSSNACCFKSSVLPLRISSVFFLCLVQHGIQWSHELSERLYVFIYVFWLFFFNFMFCSKLADQHNSIRLVTLYTYFASKSQLLKELSLTPHHAGQGTFLFCWLKLSIIINPKSDTIFSETYNWITF